MSIMEVIKRARINFQEPLEVETAKDLINYLAKNIKGNINYSISQGFYVENFSEEIVIENMTYSKLEGKIMLENGLSNDFVFENDFQENTDYSGIRFKLDKNRSYKEPDPQKVKLWDDSRRIIEEYFAKNNSKE